MVKSNSRGQTKDAVQCEGSCRQFALTSTVRAPSSCSRAQHIWWKARRGSCRSITLLSTTPLPGEAEEEVDIVLAAETESGMCSLETIDRGHCWDPVTCDTGIVSDKILHSIAVMKDKCKF